MAKLGPVTIVNADASQVYEDLRILSARPDDAEMAAAPHRLFGYVDGAHPHSAARWAEDAKREIAEAHAEGRLPVLAGGTGLYIRTLLDGIAPIPEIDPDIRDAVRALPVEQAYHALMLEDPVMAERLAPADTARISRALEVVRSTGKSITLWHEMRSGGIADSIHLAPLVLLPPRAWLFQRCDARFSGMLMGGGIAEVDRLLERRLDRSLPVMRAIGVPEIAAWRADKIRYGEMLQAGRAATRQYAKRQYTWFSRQPPADWPRLRDPLDDEAAFAAAVAMVLPA